APGIGDSLHFCPSRGRTMERKGTTVMKRYLTALLGATLVLLSFAGTRARADFIAAWSYDWSRTPSTGVISADPGGTAALPLPHQPADSASGESDILSTNIRVFSWAAPSTPDHVTNPPYSLTLSLTDTASGQHGSLTFTGQLNGKFTASSANVGNSFTGSTTQ